MPRKRLAFECEACSGQRGDGNLSLIVQTNVPLHTQLRLSKLAEPPPKCPPSSVALFLLVAQPKRQNLMPVNVPLCGRHRGLHGGPLVPHPRLRSTKHERGWLSEWSDAQCTQALTIPQASSAPRLLLCGAATLASCHEHRRSPVCSPHPLHATPSGPPSQGPPPEMDSRMAVAMGTQHF